MKSKPIVMLLLTGLLTGGQITLRAQGENPEPFLGMWALTLDYERENAGWLEVTQQEGYLDAQMLWRSGSVEPVGFTFLNGTTLFLVSGTDVVRELDPEGKPVRVTHPVEWREIYLVAPDQMEGWAYFPRKNGLGVESVRLTGKKIPPVGAAPNLKKISYGEPVALFDGNDFDGWELVDPGTVSGWKVEQGVLVNNPVQPGQGEHITYGNLRTTATFSDFNLKIEVNVPEGSNSGIYLRGRYEVQVMDSYGKPLDPHNMGALYSRITPSVAAEKPAGEWQKLDITLYQRHLTVELNGKMIIDNQPVKGVTGGAMTSDDFTPGPIFLQGDHGKVSYRNIELTPIEE